MSLFENGDYRWRETCFVLLSAATRPAAEDVRQQLQGQFEIGAVQTDGQGRLETLTLYSPNDFSAMDICFVDGEEVVEQMDELIEELRETVIQQEDISRLGDVSQYDARLDVLHFERVMDPMDGDDEFLDPGSLLLVLEGLAELCQGIGVDPQSGTII